MNIVLRLLVGLVGAVVGGIGTLISGERALNVSLMESRLEREQAYVALLDAAQIELDENLRHLRTGGPKIG